jgi:hypothetical protein
MRVWFFSWKGQGDLHNWRSHISFSSFLAPIVDTMWKKCSIFHPYQFHNPNWSLSYGGFLLNPEPL